VLTLCWTSFDAFESIGCQEAKLAIKDVHIQNVVEGGPRDERVVGSIYLERNRVRGESIISNVSEVSGGAVPVRDGESTLKITLNEVVLVECWFTVTPSRGVH